MEHIVEKTISDGFLILTEMFEELLSSQLIEECYLDCRLCTEMESFEICFNNAVLMAVSKLQSGEDQRMQDMTQFTRCTTQDAIFDVLCSTFSSSNIPVSELSTTLEECNYDLDAAIQILSARCSVNPWAMPQSPSDSATSSLVINETEAAVIQLVKSVFEGSKYYDIDIRDVLMQCEFDPDRAIEMLSVRQRGPGSHKAKKWTKLTARDTSKYRQVDTSVSYAKITSSKPVSLKLKDSSIRSADVAGKSYVPPPICTDMTVALKDHDVIANEVKYSEEMLERWRGIANRQKGAMIQEYRLACQFSGRGGINKGGTLGSHAATYAGYVSERGHMSKDLWQRAEVMCGLLVFKRTNPNIIVTYDDSRDVIKIMNLVSGSSPTRFHRLVIDLHGLVVKLATRVVDAVLVHLQHPSFRATHGIELSLLNVVFIVGRGSHSEHGISRLKPALSSHLGEMGISCQVHDGEIWVPVASLLRSA